ncbi:MAG TPA: agmatine deiminase family protein [Salinivirgaceae bacterium]|nr:agmatine deiminase family protein [Salinivirgaceae bacterium]
MRYLIFILLLSASMIMSGQDLPRGMTEYEKNIWEEYLRNYSTHRGTQPPDQIPRTPAEFEENQGVIVTWTSYTSNLREIVRYAKQVVKVYIVCSTPSSVQNYLTQGGVSLDNIEFITAPYNSVWVRDYGPQSIYLSNTYQLAFVDWVYNRPRPNDDEIPSAVANYMNIPIYQMTTNPNRLVATGGNVMADGFNKGFSSKLILNENSSLTSAQIDTIVKKYMGIRPYVKMETLPYDGIHHIDMHMKLLDEETLLVGQYPPGVSDGPQIEANLNYILTNYVTPYGRPYRVVRIPMPADENGRYPSNGSDYLTYTNSVILNNLVLVPIYGLSTDQQALQIYRNAMPGYQIVGINMRNVIPASGAIHCITHEIAANDPIFINHASIRDTLPFNPEGYLISAQISTASGIGNAKLYWSHDTTQGYNISPMTFSANSYSAYIPSRTADGKIFYFIEATNNNGKTIRKPLVAPDGVYTFYARGGFLGFDFSADNQSVTINTPVTFNFINQGVTVESIVWNFGNGAIPASMEGIGPHSIVYSTPGSKTISVTVNQTLTLTKNNYISVTEPQTITLTVMVEGEGTTTPQAGQHTLPMNVSVNFSAIAQQGWIFRQWNINGEICYSPDTTLTLNENTVATAMFEQNTGIVNNQSNELQIFPNPLQNQLNILVNNQQTVKSVTIYDITGNQRKNVCSDEQRLTIDVSYLPSGVYFVEIQLPTSITTQRIVIMK